MFKKFIILSLIILLVIGAVIVSKIFKQKRADRKTTEPEIVTIYADSDAAVNFLQGFLMGIDFGSEKSFSDEKLITALKPRFWRITDWQEYDKIAVFKPKITFVLSDIYANGHGGWDVAAPWNNWQEWEDFVKEQVRYSKSENKPVDYWDIWGEPDMVGGTPFYGDYPQLLELFSRAYKTIKSIDKNAKVIGPSVTDFSVRFRNGNGEIDGLDRFIFDLSNIYGVKLDAISWHELGSYPEEVPIHASLLREFLRKKFPGYNPEFHINEFSAEEDHLIPGWQLGWLYYLEKAGIDSVNRACWDVVEKVFLFFGKRWSDCRVGLDGLLKQDNKTTTPTYWVHRAYAELASRRLISESSAPRTIALASRDDIKNELRIILGRYNIREIGKKGPSADVFLKILDYPYKGIKADVSFYRIPNEGISGELDSPLEAGKQTIDISDNVLNIPIDDFQDGEVYIIIVRSLTTK